MSNDISEQLVSWSA